MMYTTEVQLRPEADAGRVRAFVAALHRFDCVVRVSTGRRLVCDVPPDGYVWIVTGGFAEMLGGFRDCAEWYGSFRERQPRRDRLPSG
jgi:hypothetical protein